MLWYKFSESFCRVTTKIICKVKENSEKNWMTVHCVLRIHIRCISTKVITMQIL